MKEIKLTKGMVALVDDEDFEYLNQFKWYACKCDNIYYARRSARVNGKDVKIYMHRELLNLTFGERVLVDHTDHNGLNNQKNNLRLATPSQNGMNKNIRTGISKYRGVYLHGPTKTWAARIKKDRRVISLGYFKTPELAAQAYNQAAEKYHGEFACINKIAA